MLTQSYSLSVCENFKNIHDSTITRLILRKESGLWCNVYMLSCVRAPTHTHNIMYEVNLHQRVTQITTPPRLRLNPHHE